MAAGHWKEWTCVRGKLKYKTAQQLLGNLAQG